MPTTPNPELDKMAAVRFGEVRSDLRITYAGFEVRAGASHARIAVQTARFLASVVGNPPCAKADLTESIVAFGFCRFVKAHTKRNERNLNLN